MKNQLKLGDIICSYNYPYFFPRLIIADSNSSIYYVRNPYGARYSIVNYNNYTYNTVFMDDGINGSFYYRVSFESISEQFRESGAWNSKRVTGLQ